MENIFDSYTASKVRSIKGDFIDKLHSQITVTFLLAIFILTFLKQTSTSAIYCWFQSEYGGPQAKYIHQFCWINSTYWYPNETNSESFIYREKKHIPYYQFTLFILLFQCLLFYIPSFIWKLIAANSICYINKLLDTVNRSNVISTGIKDVKEKDTEESINKNDDEISSTKILQTNFKGNQMNPEILSNETKKIFENTFSSLIVSRTTKNIDRHNKEVSNKAVSNNPSNKLTTLINGIACKYMFFKTLNLANVIFQLFLLEMIFGKNFFVYGYSYLKAIWSKQNPLFLTHFPILTFCDFYVHMPNNQIHPSTAQCILTINVLVEKFYVLIWFWFVILSIITLWNWIFWMIELFSPNVRFLSKYLNIYNSMHASNNDKINVDELINFRKDYIKLDGYVMLLIVKSVAGDIAFTELLNYLWNNYKKLKNTISFK